MARVHVCPSLIRATTPNTVHVSSRVGRSRSSVIQLLWEYRSYFCCERCSNTNNIKPIYGGVLGKGCFRFQETRENGKNGKRGETSFPLSTSTFDRAWTFSLLSPPNQPGRDLQPLPDKVKGPPRLNLGALLCSTWSTAGLHACGWIERVAGNQKTRIEGGCGCHDRRITGRAGV